MNIFIFLNWQSSIKLWNSISLIFPTVFPVTLPATIEIKIIMDDNDNCEVLVIREVDFNLTTLEEAGYNNINITVEAWNEILQYSF